MLLIIVKHQELLWERVLYKYKLLFLLLFEGIGFQAQNKRWNLHLLAPLVARFTQPHKDVSTSALMEQLF